MDIDYACRRANQPQYDPDITFFDQELTSCFGNTMEKFIAYSYMMLDVFLFISLPNIREDLMSLMR
jgi:hypothetical protein